MQITNLRYSSPDNHIEMEIDGQQVCVTADNLDDGKGDREFRVDQDLVYFTDNDGRFIDDATLEFMTLPDGTVATIDTAPLRWVRENAYAMTFKRIYRAAVAGLFGPVAPYVPPAPEPDPTDTDLQGLFDRLLQDGSIDQTALMLAIAARVEQVNDPTLIGVAELRTAVRQNIGPIYVKAYKLLAGM